MKLILHIGPGQATASALQASLKANARTLATHGVLYLGQMLEHAPAQLFDWQRPDGH
ncbi:MAG TPA: hypothetical protein VLA61_19585 [Ideonella sp.]|uniref:hypothetical protein n=1 Tax=Ideonella sp. TaxID=1929293 RepID=UPI002CE438C9|nr:hypothetical protein [Ideonella sp.]HSI50474.1 hypothetical protein [Ideonella sp.]